MRARAHDVFTTPGPVPKAKGHYAAAAYEGIGGLTLRETANAASLLHSLG